MKKVKTIAVPKSAPASDEGDESVPLQEGLLSDPEDVKKFLLAGNARITIRSLATGARFSYRVRRAEKGNGRANTDKRTPWFISVLTGPDNDNAYQYVGTIWRDGNHIHWDKGAKCKIDSGAKSIVAWGYFFNEVIVMKRMPHKLEVWHEGRCGRCGRALTVPSSIASGFGPECSGKEKL